MTDLRWGTTNPDLILGWVEAGEVTCGPAGPALTAEIERAIEIRRQEPLSDEVRRGVRDCLRHGGFKPTGRGKPASEYLARSIERAFPRVNAVVDALNLVSLSTGIPISLLDLDRALMGGAALEVREGRPRESFEFNASGQVIDVEGLVGIARVDGPLLANPVKDSMATKTTEATRRVAAALYGTRRVWSAIEVRAITEDLGRLLEEHGSASGVRIRLFDGERT